MSRNGEKSTATKTVLHDGPHRIFLVRHGETNWNREFRYQGSSDTELNEEGVEQARRAGVRLSCVTPARVYASPMKRAARTAGIIMENNHSGAALELLDDIREVSFGEWEGKTADEIMARDAEILRAWRRDPASTVPPGGESFAEVYSRASRAAEVVKGSGRACEATFVVAHGAVLRALIAALMGSGDAGLFWRVRFDNCSISVIDMWGNRPSLLTSNDTYHIRLRDEEIRLLTFPD
jgi:broad specificity phosphatase PhoE